MSVRRSIVFALGQKYASAVVAFIAIMALARVLTPDQIGIYSVAAAAITLAQTLRDFGIARYLVQEPELTELRIRSALGMAFVTAWAAAAIIFLFRGTIADFYHQPALVEVLSVLCVNFVVLPFGALAAALFQREMAFGALFVIGIGSSAANAITAVVCAFLGFGFMALAWASLAGNVVAAILAMTLRPSLVRVRPSLGEWRRIFAFGGPISITGIVNQMGAQAPDLILGRILGFAPVAIYSRALGLISIFNTYFIDGISAVAFSAFATRHRQGAQFAEDYLIGLSYVTAIGWPFFGFLAFMALPVIRSFFGFQWDAAAPILSVLCIGGMIRAIFALAAPSLIALGRVRTIMYAETVIQAVRIVVIIPAAMYSLYAVAFAQVVVYILSLIIYHYLLTRAIALSLRGVISHTWKSLCVGLVCTAPGAAIVFLSEPGNVTRLSVLIGTAVGTAALWVAAIFGLRHPLRMEIMNSCAWLRSRVVQVRAW